MNDILKHRQAVNANIQRLFGEGIDCNSEFQKAQDAEIEKARHGTYADTAENRKLNRVGQEYGHKAQEQEPSGKQPKQGEDAGGKDYSSHAQGASDEALRRAADDEKADKGVRDAAKKELEKRGKSGGGDDGGSGNDDGGNEEYKNTFFNYESAVKEIANQPDRKSKDKKEKEIRDNANAFVRDVAMPMLEKYKNQIASELGLSGKIKIRRHDIGGKPMVPGDYEISVSGKIWSGDEEPELIDRTIEVKIDGEEKNTVVKTPKSQTLQKLYSALMEEYDNSPNPASDNYKTASEKTGKRNPDRGDYGWKNSAAGYDSRELDDED